MGLTRDFPPLVLSEHHLAVGSISGVLGLTCLGSQKLNVSLGHSGAFCLGHSQNDSVSMGGFGTMMYVPGLLIRSKVSFPHDCLG